MTIIIIISICTQLVSTVHAYDNGWIRSTQLASLSLSLPPSQRWTTTCSVEPWSICQRKRERWKLPPQCSYYCTVKLTYGLSIEKIDHIHRRLSMFDWGVVGSSWKQRQQMWRPDRTDVNITRSIDLRLILCGHWRRPMFNLSRGNCYQGLQSKRKRERWKKKARGKIIFEQAICDEFYTYQTIFYWQCFNIVLVKPRKTLG